MSFELVEIKTGKVVEKFNYPFDEFIRDKYSQWFSLEHPQYGLIVGNVHPEFKWRKTKESEVEHDARY